MQIFKSLQNVITFNDNWNRRFCSKRKFIIILIITFELIAVTLTRMKTFHNFATILRSTIWIITLSTKIFNAIYERINVSTKFEKKFFMIKFMYEFCNMSTHNQKSQCMRNDSYQLQYLTRKNLERLAMKWQYFE